MSNIFTLTYLIWFISEIVLNRLKRSAHADKKHEDKNSLATIWITILMVIPLSVFIATFFRAPIFRKEGYEYVGLIVIGIGILIRFIAVNSLGKFFTVDVTIRQEHHLKKDGFYKIVRHPSYSGSILSFVGFGISLNNWISLFVVTIAVFTAFMKRIRIEERVLQNQFGEEYTKYAKETYRLIPWVY
ncbi:methyltransferase family protein [Pinibacter soli]|uniref:Isoprenylcysteine carboxylmethyltransferase family protein n=1 Tax=Pinibacter soli TaxID=3044211 RepID=A0ABT6RGU6_9BACT|nr:isoprenylcysteine carboxylmethyltransferase family protein [Pinibacter soli]MDI3321062.1 isoprenylcysteine carboxylmethyltransferase family protein [Pinibacter soli]